MPEHLEGKHVRLERLSHVHKEGLVAAGSDLSIWTWMACGPLDTFDKASAFIDSALAPADCAGPQVPYAVIARATNEVAGSTRFMDINTAHQSLEIGWTWYAPRFQRTAINTETKLLLLTCAFEQRAMLRVQFKTDSENQRSQRALERLGATREGILRNHRIRPDGTMRHSVYYSITPDEWPAIKVRLKQPFARG